MGKVSEERRQQKVALVAELAGRMRSSAATLVVGYRGLTVQEDSQLRRRLRAAGVQYRVVKNTILDRAAREAGFQALGRLCDGPTAVAFGGDPVSAAREVTAFAKDHPQLVLRGGLVDGAVLDGEAAAALAELPPRQQLLAQAAGMLRAPVAAVAAVLHAPLRSLAVMLGQLAQSPGA